MTAWYYGQHNNKRVPVSVNYHFTRMCNYQCGFCFHTAKTSYVLPLQEQKRGLQLLKAAGMKKINFSGGEPFLEARRLGEMVKFCKKELAMESVSIVSNGSLVTRDWFENFAAYVDILAISCDSFNEETNRKIGRFRSQKNHLDSLRQCHQWCEEFRVVFKLNTVVNTFNMDEDMSTTIRDLMPIHRWKIFQVHSTVTVWRKAHTTVRSHHHTVCLLNDNRCAWLVVVWTIF